MTTRRAFSAQEKMEILNEGLQPGASAVEVCRKHGIGSSLYYRWKRDAKDCMKVFISSEGVKLFAF